MYVSHCEMLAQKALGTGTLSGQAESKSSVFWLERPVNWCTGKPGKLSLDKKKYPEDMFWPC